MSLTRVVCLLLAGACSVLAPVEAPAQRARTVQAKTVSRGVITVVDVPRRPHLAQVDAARRQFYSYRMLRPQAIHTIAGGGECKLLLIKLQSERHPDLAVYKTAPPGDDSEVWAYWIPELVVEVVEVVLVVLYTFIAHSFTLAEGRHKPIASFLRDGELGSRMSELSVGFRPLKDRRQFRELLSTSQAGVSEGRPATRLSKLRPKGHLPAERP